MNDRLLGSTSSHDDYPWEQIETVEEGGFRNRCCVVDEEDIRLRKAFANGLGGTLCQGTDYHIAVFENRFFQEDLQSYELCELSVFEGFILVDRPALPNLCFLLLLHPPSHSSNRSWLP